MNIGLFLRTHFNKRHQHAARSKLQRAFATGKTAADYFYFLFHRAKHSK